MAVRWKTQGGLISPTLFNVVVDDLVGKWLAMTAEDQAVAQEGLVLNVRTCMVLLYSDYSMIGAQDLHWLQNVLNVLIGLFRRYGLVANATNIVNNDMPNQSTMVGSYGDILCEWDLGGDGRDDQSDEGVTPQSSLEDLRNYISTGEGYIEWEYPPGADVMEAAGIWPIKEYI